MKWSVLNVPEIAAALVLILFGIFVSVESLSYPLGSLRRMGAGYLPFYLGLGLVGLGLVQLWQSVRMQREAFAFAWRPVIFVSASVLSFVFLAPHLGLVPTAVIMILLSAFAEQPPSLKTAVITAGFMSIVGYFLFIRGLAIALDPFWW